MRMSTHWGTQREETYWADSLKQRRRQKKKLSMHTQRHILINTNLKMKMINTSRNHLLDMTFNQNYCRRKWSILFADNIELWVLGMQNNYF